MRRIDHKHATKLVLKSPNRKPPSLNRTGKSNTKQVRQNAEKSRYDANRGDRTSSGLTSISFNWQIESARLDLRAIRIYKPMYQSGVQSKSACNRPSYLELLTTKAQYLDGDGDGDGDCFSIRALGSANVRVRGAILKTPICDHHQRLIELVWP